MVNAQEPVAIVKELLNAFQLKNNQEKMGSVEIVVNNKLRMEITGTRSILSGSINKMRRLS